MFLAGAGCGRYGFELARDAVDSGPGTTDAAEIADATAPDIDGAPGADAAIATIDAALPAGCMIVTTAADEDDPGESAQPPHQGAGLSLREAIGVANDTAGRDCIAFQGTLNIRPTSNLPGLSDVDGAVIDGTGANVVIDGLLVTGTGAVGLNLLDGGCEVKNISLTNWGPVNGGVAVRAFSSTTIGPGVSISNADTGVNILGSATDVLGSRFSQCTTAGVSVANGVANVLIAQNVFATNPAAGIELTAGSATVIRHNDFFQNATGIDAATGATLSAVENNAFVQNASFAIDANGVSVVALDFNGYFLNGGECRGCTTGANALFANPMFASPPNDMTLQSGSLYVDAALDSGLDVNGARPGLFDGDGPDIGAVESQ